jgi:hypothetical protein
VFWYSTILSQRVVNPFPGGLHAEELLLSQGVPEIGCGLFGVRTTCQVQLANPLDQVEPGIIAHRQAVAGEHDGIGVKLLKIALVGDVKARLRSQRNAGDLVVSQGLN